MDPERVDVFCFELERNAGREALTAGRLDRARELLERALARWRGPMLAGVPLGPVVTSRTVVAEEERLLTVEILAGVQLRSGRNHSVIPLLREVIVRHPLREPAYALLMRALCERGDHAGALVVYDAVRTTFSEELGVEPGPDIQGLHLKIITEASAGEPAINVSPRPTSARWLAADAPAPTDERHRRAPVDHLPRAVTDAARSPQRPRRRVGEGGAASGWLRRQHPVRSSA
ncbi:AfsR/SARP family transcriptional regulator [Micromonospora zamorensis]|uniref:AfsR/SARP family transcriptional regulator n=1 Tax=Micromonospora zamorensis TaxID=709883 RepID=UPI0033D301C9